MTVVVIEPGTVDILECAYKDRTDITEVRFPYTVQTVGNRAFSGCSSLVKILFCNGLRPNCLKFIDYNAFERCSGIVDLHLPNGIESIGDRAFFMCTGIVGLQLPDTLQSVGNDAFHECTGIVTLHLPDALQSIGDGAFGCCSGIVDLHFPDTLRSIGDGAFAACSGIVDLHLPDTLQSIGNMAFLGCSGIVDLHLPNTLQKIGNGAFRDCRGLTTILLPTGPIDIRDDSPYSNGAFHGCTSLTRVLAPDTLVRGEASDPSKVFEGCPVLTGAGLTPYSAVPLLRRTLWHPTMHALCTLEQHECVVAVLVAELRSDRQEEETAPLPLLVHDLWLLILEFVPRDQLGRP